MLIVGENLRGLIRQRNIVTQSSLKECFDENSITLFLDRTILRIKAPTGTELEYGQEIPGEYIDEEVLKDHPLRIAPKGAVLGCSSEEVNFPMGYFGLLQTKGSLARMFISVCCCDGQVEGGFRGKITFEIVNHSNFTVVLRPLQPVAQLFVFKPRQQNLWVVSGSGSRPSV